MKFGQNRINTCTNMTCRHVLYLEVPAADYQLNSSIVWPYSGISTGDDKPKMVSISD